MFNSWVGKIPWRWKWQAAYSPWGHKGQTRLSDSTTALPPPPFVISELRSREFSSSQCQHFLSFLPFSFFFPPLFVPLLYLPLFPSPVLGRRCLMIFVIVQLPSLVQLFVIPWTAARQASLSLTVSQSLH